MRGDFLIEHGTGAANGDIYMLDNGSPNVQQRVFAMYGTNGNTSLAVGPRAGASGTNADARNTYVGFNAGNAAVANVDNTFIGANSGLVYSSSNSTGFNTFVGSNSGVQLTDGTLNTFVGRLAGNAFTTGTRNTVLGAQAANGGTADGDDNVVIGWETYFLGSGGPLTSATRSILIGNGAHVFSNGATVDNSVSIGFDNRVVCDNCVTIASQLTNATLNEQQVGIGYTNPTATTITPTPIASNLAKLYVRDFNFGGTAAYFNGAAYASAGFNPSDVALKQNIVPFNDASAILDQLEAKSFDFKHQDFPSLALPKGNQIGFLAQDIEVVAPQLVQIFSNPATLDSLGNVVVPQVDIKAVNYAGLVPILFTAIKQQKAMLDSLAAVVSNCCSNPQPLINDGNNPVIKSSVALSNKETIVLNQNSPNPFRDRTEITYTLPESVQDAVIMFYDHSGKVIQKFEISHRGAGSLTVYGEDLTSGVYTYSLIIDGENHQTKRMVKQ